VTFQGKPLPSGVIIFVGDKAYNGALDANGSYAIAAIKPGSYKIVVTTEADKLPKPAKDAKEPEDTKPAKTFVPIPKKYADAETSGLTAEVKNGENNFDLELK
jgi:hypothetical protein